MRLSVSGLGIAGRLPNLGELTSLQELRLDGNRLDGTFGSWIGNLVALRLINASNNKLFGVLPAELGNLRSLRSLSLMNNNLTGAIPPTFQNLQSAVFINLSKNDFRGSIPSELGALTNLSVLLLQENEFTGPVPESLSNLKKLEQLDVSSNMLDGDFPRSVASIPSLLALFDSQRQNCTRSFPDSPINPSAPPTILIVILSITLPLLIIAIIVLVVRYFFRHLWDTEGWEFSLPYPIEKDEKRASLRGRKGDLKPIDTAAIAREQLWDTSVVMPIPGKGVGAVLDDTSGPLSAPVGGGGLSSPGSAAIVPPASAPVGLSSLPYFTPAVSTRHVGNQPTHSSHVLTSSAHNPNYAPQQISQPFAPVATSENIIHQASGGVVAEGLDVGITAPPRRSVPVGSLSPITGELMVQQGGGGEEVMLPVAPARYQSKAFGDGGQ
ncbi:hypothetical protein HDU67_007340 [Dinochytrium kinnereticum]|nr:hypothetical protein HDU67_007340 [Dinochytrium kinnereticum]